MQILKALLFSIVCAGLIHADTSNTLTEQEKKAGWRLLFNGTDLTGWRLYGKQDPPADGWKVEDGLLKKVPKRFGGDIITTETFTDYELSWEWRIDKNGNNGIKYLVSEERRRAPGPEYQMLDDDGHPDAKVGPKRHTASLYDILPPENATLNPIGEWNHSRIIIRGRNVEHWLNGAKVLSYRLGSRQLSNAIAASKFKNEKDFGEKITGHIMLTDHSDGCDFRNIKLLPL